MSSHQIHIFGNLFLPDPRDHLSKVDLEEFNRWLPLIEKFKSSGTEDQVPLQEWNHDAEFERFQKKECDWWIAHGVERDPREMVCMSGDLLTARVLCHLFNPTWSVEDRYFQKIQDPSSKTITQLILVGFKEDNHCLLFDHIARRDLTQNIENYPEELIDTHEDFSFGLRDAATAPVELCWGSRVRDRMFKKLGKNLQALRLWAQYAGVTVYLELTSEHDAMKRFVIFVDHPQRFMYVKSDSERARNWRRRFGIPQDRALAVAALLGRIKIEPHFYERDPRLLQNFMVTREITARKNYWKRKAGMSYAELSQMADFVQESHIESPTSKIRKPPRIFLGFWLNSSLAKSVE